MRAKACLEGSVSEHSADCGAANDITRCLAADAPPRAAPEQPFQSEPDDTNPNSYSNQNQEQLQIKSKFSFPEWVATLLLLETVVTRWVTALTPCCYLGISNWLSHTRSDIVSPIIWFTCRRVQQVLHSVPSLALFDFHLLTTSIFLSLHRSIIRAWLQMNNSYATRLLLHSEIWVLFQVK